MRILVTGAAGGVATLLRPALLAETVRVVDRREAAGWDGARTMEGRETCGGNDTDPMVRREAPGWMGAETVVGDLADPVVAARAVDGVDAVVHLAGSPRPQAPWDELLPANVQATAVLLEAAAAAGVRRVVLASSVHAVGALLGADARQVDPAAPPRPCCRYGASKGFVESAGAAAAYQFGLSVVCLRLGGCTPAPLDAAHARLWIGPEDLRALITASLTADLEYGVFAGVSANTTSPLAAGSSKQDLGWRPAQNSASYDFPPADTGAALCNPN